jgi:hypothetical protein
MSASDGNGGGDGGEVCGGERERGGGGSRPTTRHRGGQTLQVCETVSCQHYHLRTFQDRTH